MKTELLIPKSVCPMWLRKFQANVDGINYPKLCWQTPAEYYEKSLQKEIENKAYTVAWSGKQIQVSHIYAIEKVYGIFYVVHRISKQKILSIEMN